ncbi:MAG: hypothetical protein IPJ13_29000 [Saprospiraceae bacterium]|nr:hypothetical protein [Saprospiraceae bacterium]
MAKKYPKTLSSGSNNTVFALSESEAGKLFFENTRSEIGSEAGKMKFAGVSHFYIKLYFSNILEVHSICYSCLGF